MARTTTDAKNWRFNFTVTDLARFLGKSPVTLRKWESKGEVTIPRDGNERKLHADHISGIAKRTYTSGRISRRRRDLVCALMTMIETVERENIK